MRGNFNQQIRELHKIFTENITEQYRSTPLKFDFG